MMHFFSPARWGIQARGWLAGSLLALLPLVTTAQKVAAGASFSFSIHADGSLWGSGYNQNGQVGDGTGVQRPLPVKLGTST